MSSISALKYISLVLAAVVSFACSGIGGQSGSADARDIAYVRDGQLYRFSPTSRAEKKIVELPTGGNAKDVVWSPDGTRIAFSFFAPPQRGVQPGSDIYTAKADGTDLKVLVKHELPGELLETPYFFPDGSAIVYSRFAPILQNNQYVGDTLEVLKMDLKSNTVKPLVKDGIGPSISPDGKQLAYVQINARTAGQSLWIAGSDGSNPKQLVAEDSFAAIYWPRISPSGDTVAFAGAIIPTFKTPGGLFPGLAKPLPGGLAHGLPTDVYTVSVAGSKPVRLTNLNEDDPTPLWSTDGKRFIIVGAYAIYSADADGQNLSKLREPGGIGGGDWRG